MSKKVFTFLLIAFLLGAILTACERPASTAPNPTATGGSIPFPVVEPTNSVSAFATQTAIAKNPVVTATQSEPGSPTAQPTQEQPGQATPPTQAEPTQAAPTATEAPVIIPTATPGRPSSYTIQPGDHYVCVARRYNLDLAQFLAVNGLTMNSQAVVGVTVKIPQSGSWNPENGSRTLRNHPDTYTVQAGDTINKVACYYGDVDPNSIILANNLKSPYTLSPGQKLKIP